MTGFRAIPADDQMIDNFADSAQSANCFAHINVVAVDTNDAFEADTIRQSPNNQRGDIKSF